MIEQINTNIRLAVDQLAEMQELHGGFGGYASSRADDWRDAQRRPTIFFSCLILQCLASVPEAAAVAKQAAEFLLRHRSEEWSWNYWERGDSARPWHSYPDDMDDTSCALAALYTYQSGVIDGSAVGHYTRQLIATETKPGGPYTTWLVEQPTSNIWLDTDIAVNANIGYFLSLLGVQAPGLEQYMANAIQHSRLTSRYYVGEIPILYFLSRWYQGTGYEALKTIVCQHLRHPEGYHAMHLAMLMTAAGHLKCSDVIAQAGNRLIHLANTNSWDVAALYYEPPQDGRLRYAGSKALTNAFCIEALAMQRRLLEIKPSRKRKEELLPVIDRHLPKELADVYAQTRRRIVQRDHDGQVRTMATHVAQACSIDVSHAILRHLNNASLHGWMAYTIYDDFWDQEESPHMLGVANLTQRRALGHFRAALPRNDLFQQQVMQTFDIMDGANTWEVMRARADCDGGIVYYRALPDYGDYHQLAERSLGHGLAGCGVLLAAGESLGGRSVQALKRFFFHLQIARQLNDDAHDWVSDLRAGRLTSVVTLILQTWGPHKSGRVDWSRDQSALHEVFWDSVIEEVVASIQRHCMWARAALADCERVVVPDAMTKWVAALEQSGQQALDERRRARQFIATLGRPTRLGST